MHELTITPLGHLLVREAAAGTPERRLSKGLLEAYAESPARGMLYSASEDSDAALPVSFEFARSIARLYLTNLCKAATPEPGASIPEIAPPSADLDRAILQAPPMTGLEYLTPDVLATWWQDLDALARREIAKHPGGAQAYLRERNPQWRFVGRVTLHLAENKRNPDYPFAFLATYANGLTPQGKVKHEPLGRAIQQYAGARNREAMLTLLLPISKAAESSELIRDLVDSGEIYQPLAWSPREAYEFLQAIPLLESSGLIVRVPDWWNAKKPTRPRVSVKIDSKKSGGIGVDSLMDFSVGVSLDGETLEPGRDRPVARIQRGAGPPQGEVGRGRSREAEGSPGALEEGRAGRASGGDLVLRGDAAPLRGEPRPRGRGRRPGRDPRMVGPDGRPGAGRDPRGAASPETRHEKAPPGLKAELRPYQRTGYAWLRFVARLGLGAAWPTTWVSARRSR